MNENEETVFRYTLTQDWKDLQKKVDWMEAPYMPEYVNKLTTGIDLADNGHWATYAREKFVTGMLKNRRRRSLSMVSLACGDGLMEEALIKEFNWPISTFLGLGYDAALRSRAQERFATIRSCKSNFEFFDFNHPDVDHQYGFEKGPQFDIVFVWHALHHATNIELALNKINKMMKPDGLFIGIYYFGPSQFQIEHEVLTIIRELFDYLPADLRLNLSTPEMIVDESFKHPTISEGKTADISEAPRSSDLREFLFSNFPVVEIKPLGETILRWLLRNRAGNFRKDVQLTSLSHTYSNTSNVN